MTFPDCYNMEIPDWGPLERAVSFVCAGNVEADPDELIFSFLWMGEWRKGEHQYKHRDTRNYAILRANSSEMECRQEIKKALSWARTWGVAMDARLEARRG